MSAPTTWAVLLCRYLDDNNDPTNTTIKELAEQWVSTFPAPVAAGETVDWDTNTNTILGACQHLFNSSDLFPRNMVNYFSDMSHGRVNLSDTQIYPVVVQRTLADATQAANGSLTGGAIFQNDNFHRAKVALQEQHDVDPATFYAIIVCFQQPDWGSQGGPYDGGRGVYMDIRYVVNNGPKRWGHEMGHGFGLDHSRADTNDPNFNPWGCGSPPPDYRDPWDVMSAECCYADKDPDLGPFGPGINAWNMRSRSWLDETRVWQAPSEDFSEVVILRPLHRPDLPGYLAAELPPLHDQSVAPSDFPRYLVEFRPKAGWDTGFKNSCVLVHHYEGAMGQFLYANSYVELPLDGKPPMVSGDICGLAINGGNMPLVRIMDIDEKIETATVRLSYLSYIDIAAAQNLDGHLEVFFIAGDFSIRHFWQAHINGTWWPEMPKIQDNVSGRSITMLQNSANELEIFYVGTDWHVYHNWQTTPNGNWNGEVEVSDSDSAKQVVAANNANGRMQIFYRGTNDHLYYNTKKPNAEWVGEHDLGDQVTKVGVGVSGSGTLELCYIGIDAQFYHRAQSSMNAYDGWGPRLAFGDTAEDFSIVVCADQSLEIVYINGSSKLCHVYQNGKDGSWSTPQVIVPFAKTLAVAINSSNLLDMFFTDQTDVIFHLQQSSVHQWQQAPTRFQAAAKKLILIPNKDRHLELIYIGTNDALYHNWQIGTSNNWAGEALF